MNNFTEFRISFDGEALKNNEIPPKDLSEALHGIDNLLTQANLIFNGKKYEVKVAVKASFQTGSFKIDFKIYENIFNKTINLFSSDTYSAIVNASETLSLLYFGSRCLLFLLKFLKGERPTKIYDNQDGSFSIYKGDKYLKVEKKVLKAYENYQLRKAFEQTISPLEKNGISSCVFSKKNRNGYVFSEIKEDEYLYFSCEKTDLKLMDKPSVTKTRISILNLSFKKENKWYVNDGQSSFYTRIEDNNFLNKIENNEISFSKGDILLCNIRREQFLDKDDNKLIAKNYIEKVLEHTKEPVQKSLGFF